MKLPPLVIGLLVLAFGWCILAAGVYLLAGLGWALVCAAAFFIGLAFIIFRGITSEQ